MFNWIISNIGTIIVTAVIAAAVAALIIKMVKNKRKGKTFCSCGCSSCPMNECCSKNS